MESRKGYSFIIIIILWPIVVIAKSLNWFYQRTYDYLSIAASCVPGRACFLQFFSSFLDWIVTFRDLTLNCLHCTFWSMKGKLENKTMKHRKYFLATMGQFRNLANHISLPIYGAVQWKKGNGWSYRHFIKSLH